ncbi:MAG TPA: arginine--tRNA ligase [Planctomycetaceae bacterium]|nr:arginine--tRNA ligase [Planctomycetaceae bacterium]
MNVLARLQAAFRSALDGLVDSPSTYLEMIRPSQDPKFGDYQANLAMPLKSVLGGNPRDIAAKIVERLDVSALCDPPEIAGPGFINLRLRDEVIVEMLRTALRDERLGIAPVAEPKTVIVDFSSPNVAKPMHVGHIRSTVIGDSLSRILRFLGHRVITDNHLGDWGTQFGMIIYGFKHLRDESAYAAAPVAELGRLYRQVRAIMDYRAAVRELPKAEAEAKQLAAAAATAAALAAAAQGPEAKKAAGDAKRAARRSEEAAEQLASLREKIAKTEASPAASALAAQHADIERAVLDETAALHAGDAENRRLWEEFLPYCREDIQRIYERLAIRFDEELGESFYHPWLGETVDDLTKRGLVRDSDGAACVFLDGFDSPMIVRKRDGAYLYATTDLATIRYRVSTWNPDLCLYVVDHRQSEHFAKLFAAAKVWGFEKLELRHVSFGTVMGDDGRPFKTRSGDTVGLEGLLDEAVTRARAVVDENLKKNADLEFDETERQRIAETVGIGALKYADLSQNRSSDYVFSYDKMLALKGNTAPYLLYPYARVNGIFARGEVDAEALRRGDRAMAFVAPEERRLALLLLQFENVLLDVTVDWLPNLLAAYLYEVTTAFSQFYERCSVLDAPDETSRTTRLALCDLLRRTVRTGLDLLGIGVVERM